MKQIKPYLVIAVVVLVTMAIVFRVAKAKQIVTGQA